MYFDLLSKSKCFLIKGAQDMPNTSRLLIRVFCLMRIVQNYVSLKADIKYLIYLIVESIKSTKNVSKSQLCAGHKIVKRKPTKFYEYTGEHRQTNFTEIDPIKEGYKDKYHDKVAFTSYIP